MMIGIGIRVKRPSNNVDDEVLLRSIGCEKIFIDENPLAIGTQVPQFEQYLRAGDTLAVVELNRIGRKIEQIIETVDRLHKANIAVRIESDGIVPGTGIGDAFVLVCSRLAAELRVLHTTGDQHAEAQRRRGRPAALTPEMRARAEQFLSQRQGSVLEIARILRVSPATIYRYFPGRKSAPKSDGPASGDG